MQLLFTFLVISTAALAKADHALCTNLFTHDPGAPDPVGNGGFYVFSPALNEPLGYTPGESYRVVLAGESAFGEFSLVAQDGADTAQGTWSVQDASKSTTTDCMSTVPASAAVTSVNNASVLLQEFTWTAPATDVGAVSFIYSVVDDTTAYLGLNATENRPTFRSLASIPDGCQPEKCDYHAAWRQSNDFDFVDFSLQGRVQGWLALGLSEDQLMGADDVLACQLDSNGTVNVKDTFNIDDRNTRNNFIDDPHIEDHDLASQGIVNVETANVDGRISCSFARRKEQSSSLQDRDLNEPSFLLFGLDPDDTGDASNHLTYHDFMTPIVSTRQVVFNLTVAEEEFDDLVPVAQTGTIFPPPVLPRLGSYSQPDGCGGDACDYTVEWFMDGSENIQFVMSASTTGWVAIGLSGDDRMSGAEFDDVIACQAEVGGASVNAKDMHNPMGGRSNALDTDQSGTTLVEGEVSNGRISCSVRRAITTGDSSQDRPLNQAAYIFFAYGSRQGDANSILNHHGADQRFISDEELTLNQRQEAVPVTGMSLGTFRSPAGCSQDNCDYFVERFMDGTDNIIFRMTAATTGWVAFGLSGDSRMSGAEFDDVIACQAEVGGASVNAKDMHNPMGARTNALDTDQSGTTLVEGEVSNGRISCSVRRAITTGDSSQDRPLNQAAFFLFAFGPGQGGPNDMLDYHGRPNRFLSGSPLVATDAGDVGVATDPAQPYIQAHGILMIWAWVFLAATAIFYARYTRPAYVTGQWFEVHRAFLTASVVLTDVSFIVIFVGLQGFLEFGEINPLGSAHFIIGVIVVTFQIYNPIIAAFRCPPGAKLRPIFDVIHGILVGTVVELLSFVNCALGVWLFTLRTERTAPFYLLVVTLIILIAFELAMGVYHFVAKYIVKSLSEPPESSKKAREVEMRELETPQSEKKDGSKSPSPPPKKKVPSKDAKFRMLMGIIYPVAIFLFLVIITILIAVGQY